MSDDLGWLWDNRTSYDRKQNERLDSLSSQLFQQRSEAGRLQARLAKVQGDLQGRVDRLATAFDAFVELCDVREDLRAFEPVADARNRARRVVKRLIATGRSAGQPVLPPAADVSPELADYWLPRAVAGLVATVRGDRAAADAALAEARGRDAARTDLFLCLAFAVSERTEPAVDLLPGLLDLRADRPVTRAQRELWLAAGVGRLGDRGPDVVVGRLTALTTGLHGEVRAANASAWRDTVAAVPAGVGTIPSVPSSTADLSGLAAPLRAAHQMDALAAWYEQAAHPAPADRPETTGEDPADPLYALLRQLVDEGVPDEQPLLARMAELRRTIEADGGVRAAAPPRWDETLDIPQALLLADADSPDAGCRAVAARAAAPLLATVAADFAIAASQPLPPRIEAGVNRHRIGFTAAGADEVTVAAARDAAAADPPPDVRGATRIAVTMVAVAVLLVVVGMALGITLATVFGTFLGLLGGGVAARAYTRRRDAADRAGRQANEWARTEQRIAGIETALAELWAQAGRAATDAAAARARFEERLPAATPAAGPADAAAPPLSAR